MVRQISLANLQRRIAKFSDERNWRQHHNPKNLALSILIEAGELAEHFQWETPQQAMNYRDNPKKRHEIAMELADVLHYCLQLADAMGIDPAAAIVEKLEYAAKKYPKIKSADLEFVRKRHEQYRRKR